MAGKGGDGGATGKKRKDDLDSVRGVPSLVCGGFCRVWR